MIRYSRFLERFNKFTSQRCNTQMLRSSHKEMSLSLTIINCVAATTYKLINNMWAYYGINNLFFVNSVNDPFRNKQLAYVFFYTFIYIIFYTFIYTIIPFEIFFRDIKNIDLSVPQTRAVKSKILDTAFSSFDSFSNCKIWFV